MGPSPGSSLGMSSVKLIDTMRDFIFYWRDYSGRSPEEMFSGWLMRYISGYPELLISEVTYWGGLDRLRSQMIEVLEKIDDLIHDLIEVWMIFLQNVGEVYSMALERLEFPETPIIEIYLGSGWKPRWVSSILDRPALFFDLGALASLSWVDRESVRGVIAFGLGQFRQAVERGGAERYAMLEENPYFQLYSQGLAQFLEKLILGEDSWHGVREREWAEECEKRMGELAALYLETARSGPVSKFYSPHQSVMGLAFTGRYLGYRLISELRERGLDLDRLLRIPEGEAIRAAEEFLEEMSGR